MRNIFYVGHDANILICRANLQPDPQTVSQGPVPAILSDHIKRGHPLQDNRFQEPATLIKICLRTGEFPIGDV